MIWRTRLSSLAVSTRPQNETVFSKCLALLRRLPASGAVQSRVEHPGTKVQRNLPRPLYGANGQSPACRDESRHGRHECLRHIGWEECEKYALAGGSACPTLVQPCRIGSALSRRPALVTPPIRTSIRAFGSRPTASSTFR